MATQFDVSVLIKVLNQASGPAAKIASDIRAFTDKSINNLNRLAQSSKDLGKKISDVGTGLTTKLTLPTAAFGVTAAMAWNKQAQAIASVESGLKATGGVAGRTLDQLTKQASALQEKTLFGDEEILAGATAQLLTFTNIAGTEFDRTQKAVLDVATKLSATKGGTADLTGTAIMLGKALNDPVANLGALSRSGIQFTEQQKKMIKALVDSGKTAEAQSLILTELEKQYGGSAEAAAKAGTGGIKQLQNSLGDLYEEFGKLIVESINPLIPKLKELTSRAIAFVQENPRLIKMIGAFIGIAAAVGPVLFIFGKLTSLFGTLISGFGSLIKFASSFGKILLFVGKVGFKSIMLIGRALLALNAMGGPILWILLSIGLAALLIYKYWKPIRAFFVKLFTTIWGVFSKLLDNPFFRAIGTIFLPFITIPALIFKHWKSISTFFVNIWSDVSNGFKITVDFMKSAINGFVSSISNVYSMITEFFSSIWKSVYDNFISFIDSIFEKINSFVESVNEIYNKIKSFFSGGTSTITLKTEQMAPDIQKSIVDSKSETDIKIKILSDKGVTTETEGISRKRGDANVSIQNSLSGSFAVN